MVVDDGEPVDVEQHRRTARRAQRRLDRDAQHEPRATVVADGIRRQAEPAVAELQAVGGHHDRYSAGELNDVDQAGVVDVEHEVVGLDRRVVDHD